MAENTKKFVPEEHGFKKEIADGGVVIWHDRDGETVTKDFIKTVSDAWHAAGDPDIATWNRGQGPGEAKDQEAANPNMASPGITEEEMEERLAEQEERLMKVFNKNMKEQLEGILGEKKAGAAIDPIEALVEMIKSKDKQTDKLIQSMMGVATQGRQANGMNEPLPLSEIDLDDLIVDKDGEPSPKTFFAYSFFWTDFGYKTNGQYIAPPYGRPVKFEREYRYEKKGSTRFDKTTIAVCKCVVHSKKVLAYLENHPLYKVKFWESTKGAVSANVQIAEKMVEISNRLNSMTQHAVLMMAQERGINIASADIQETRRSLMLVMAEQEIKSEDAKQAVRAAAYRTPAEEQAAMKSETNSGEKLTRQQQFAD